MKAKGGYVYILCSLDKTTLYTGVTANLQKRLWEHQTKHHTNSFTSAYNCTKLVYNQFFDTIIAAIEEEKRIKAGSRAGKVKLIERMNYMWEDLSKEVL